jgi:hypothetical protein
VTRLAFLGPSLAAADARRIDPELVVLPPAGMGDLVSAARRHRPTSVALIDGTFMQNMSVFHKEILHLLSDGIRVVGAASMGAIRAAEMRTFGMIGVGQVYGGYADGSIADDDEVALSHAGADDGFRALSDAMVNIRATLDQAVASGILARSEADALARTQKQRWFPHRSLPAVLADARALGTVDNASLASLEILVRRGGVDVKRDDAIAAVTFLATLPTELAAPGDRPAMSLSAAYLSTLDRDVSVGTQDGAGITFERIRFHCALNDPDFDSMWRRSLRRTILLRLAAQIGVVPDAAALVDARRDTLAALGCDPEHLDDRLLELDMTPSDLEELIAGEATILRLERWLTASAKYSNATGPFLNELRLAGRYVEVRRQAGMFDRLAEGSPANELPIPMDQLIGLQALITGWEPPADLDTYVDHRAFGHRAHLYDQLMVSVVALHELFDFPLDESSAATEPIPGLVAHESNTRGG